MNYDAELESFKKIDLIAYAIHRGYEIDKNKTSGLCTDMNNGTYRIGVSLKEDGNWYCYNFDLEKGGTIIQFAQDFDRSKNLGEVRKELRQFGHLEKPIQQKYNYSKPKPAHKNRIQILNEFSNAKLLIRSSYLNTRGINNGTLKNKRFYGNILTDDNNNVCFPNWDEKGISGIEKKNKGFQYFSKGGDRGIWFSKATPNDNKIAIFESGIDALSYFKLKDDGKTQYVSIGGQLGNNQERLIKKIINKNTNKKIILAFDHDAAGLKYINKIIYKNEHAKNIESDIPKEKGQDWNDVLKSQLGLTSNLGLSL